MKFDRIQSIDFIMTHLDFESVHKVMELLEWKWGDYNRVPTIEELKRTANYLLNEITKEPVKGCISTGGFIARLDEEGLSLSFEIKKCTFFKGGI